MFEMLAALGGLDGIFELGLEEMLEELSIFCCV